jgi:hypothetical protein
MVIPAKPRDSAKPTCALAQFEDDTVRILKPCHLSAGADRKPCCRRSYVPAMSAAVRKLWAVPTSSPPETPMVPKPKLLTLS